MSFDNPEWREFELIVARIEEYLSDNDAVVTSPDKVLDNDTGKMREVDATIRYKIGSVELLIIFECRRHKRRQGTLWIEQLASKRRALGAAKCVAISSTGFSVPAIKKAERLGVELRTLKNINKDTIERWTSGNSWFYQRRISDLSFTFEEAMDLTSAKMFHLDKRLNKKIKKKFATEP